MSISSRIAKIPSGEIALEGRGCFVGDQKVDCPSQARTGVNQVTDKLNILPNINILNKRSDLLFTSILLTIILGFSILTIFKVKIFGKTLEEYIRPIWYFVLITIAIVFWQYLVGVNLNPGSIQLKVSQWIWEAMVLASAYKLSKVPSFSYGNMFFLGILYSIIIHGLKVSIRYFFYAKTLLYVLDRFLYGSLLVMVITLILGSVFVYLQKNREVVK